MSVGGGVVSPDAILIGNNFNYLSLSFLICKMGIIRFISFSLKIDHKNQKRT